MKKLLSLLLICTMILSLATISIVSADGEGYKISNGTISSSNKRFTLNIATITAAQSGYVTIKYDTNKVTLLKRVDTDTGEVDDEDEPIIETTYPNAITGDVDFVYSQTSCAYSKQTVDISKGIIRIDWFNTSGVAANKNVARLYFIAIDGTGDNFTESTFTTVTAAADLANLGVTHSAYVGTSAGDNELGADAYTWAYKNANVADENGSTDTPIAEDFSATATEAGASKTDEITSGTVSYNDTVIEMGTNGVVHTFFAKAVEDLDAFSYGVNVTINGNAYKFPGRAKVEANQAWAIKFIIPNGTFENGTAIESFEMSKY